MSSHTSSTIFIVDETAVNGMTTSPALEQCVVTNRVPPGEEAAPQIALAGCGYYVRWFGVTIFSCLIPALHPFEVGMSGVLWTAAVVSLIAALAWWFISEHSLLRRPRPEESCAEQENAVAKK